jgi:hypothetical protein
MKTIKTILILCVALCFATSCKKGVDMTLVQKTILENANIRQIEVSDAWEVTVVADSNTYVELEYSAYLENSLKTRMEGTKLEIGFSGYVYHEINSVFRATVHTPQIEIVEADDAAQVQCKGEFAGQHIKIALNDASRCNGLVFSGESCEITLESASVMTGFRFVGNSCSAELKDASQCNSEIAASESIQIQLGDGSRFVNKGGTTEQANIHLDSASLLNMVETEVKTMEVELTGESEATVHVTEMLRGTLTDASTLYYKGHPQTNIDCSEDSQLIPF